MKMKYFCLKNSCELFLYYRIFQYMLRQELKGLSNIKKAKIVESVTIIIIIGMSL